MPYADEELLEKREEAKKKKYQTLEDGIYLDGRVLSFERTGILDSFSVCLPDVMKIMPLDYARIKYPSEFRPQMILTTEDLSVNMGFTAFPNEMDSDDPEGMAVHMEAAIHRSNPNCRMYPVRELKEISGNWFAFRSHAMDSSIYNMMLLTAVGGRLIQGSFNCVYEEYRKWKKIVLLMWESIRPLTKEEQL